MKFSVHLILFYVTCFLFFVFIWFLGEANMMQILIDHNADFNSQDYEDNTPLHLATAGGLLNTYTYIGSGN